MKQNNKDSIYKESIAFSKITLDLLNQKKREYLRLWIVVLALIGVNLAEATMFMCHKNRCSAYEITTEIIEKDTDNIIVEQTEQFFEDGEY